eukprot:TRINITY_DN41682_c0_g1_i1.p1 TRINITY_DN41682_c0_g1~~TRINITY_DN41682_c0_g1_i1.p1  ORF type:complete len:262 (+),score=10.44 TRINITY_DN41682_c0_g1_i1:118-903(+)
MKQKKRLWLILVVGFTLFGCGVIEVEAVQPRILPNANSGRNFSSNYNPEMVVLSPLTWTTTTSTSMWAFGHGFFDCTGINLFEHYTKIYGLYFSDQVTHICETTPVNGSDTANLLHYRNIRHLNAVVANLMNEPTECQRFSFSNGPTPEVTGNPYDPCTEGTACEACKNPQHIIGSLHIKRFCLKESDSGSGECMQHQCRIVKNCCDHWPEDWCFYNMDGSVHKRNQFKSDMVDPEEYQISTIRSNVLASHHVWVGKLHER